MNPTSQTPTSARRRPNSAPAYYLARPANLWISTTTRHAAAPDKSR